MRNKNSLFIMLVLLTGILSNTADSKTARKINCDGEAAGNYNTARGACRSGEFPGEVIVSCKNNGKETDRRTCNSDGNNKGIFLRNCGGTSLDESNFTDACDSGDYDGQLLVQCKRGREAKHHQCPIRQVIDPGTVVHEETTEIAQIGIDIREKFPTKKAANKSTDPKFIDSHTKSFGIGHQELVGFGITMVAHTGGGPAPGADKIIEWDGDLANPNLLLFEKSRGNRSKWPIIGMGYSTLYDSTDIPEPLSIDGVEYPFLIHEAGYHPITNGGFNCATNRNLKSNDYENGKRIDREGRQVITRDDLKHKPGQVKHGRIWSHHIWFEPGTNRIAVAKTDPWRRQNPGAHAVGDCAFFEHQHEEE